jgi:hypothetical protein
LIRPKPYELWYGDFPYEENTNNSKDRPVLLVRVFDEQHVRAMKITRFPERGEHENFMEIEKWREAGLRERSAIEIRKVFNLPVSKLRHRIGELQESDVIRLKFWLS